MTLLYCTELHPSRYDFFDADFFGLHHVFFVFGRPQELVLNWCACHFGVGNS